MKACSLTRQAQPDGRCGWGRAPTRPGNINKIQKFHFQRRQQPLMAEESPPALPPKGDAAFARLVALLSDEDPSMRWKAAEGLARLGDPRALGPLAEALRDPDWRVRMKAAWGLGKIGDLRAVGPLRRAMANPAENDRVREIIEEAVREIGMRGTG